jgi:hypothetical protein
LRIAKLQAEAPAAGQAPPMPAAQALLQLQILMRKARRFAILKIK